MADEVTEHNPPEDWRPPVPPTVENEEELLAEAFGEPDEHGVYAPHIPGSED
jgi:hypothetical protein